MADSAMSHPAVTQRRRARHKTLGQFGIMAHLQVQTYSIRSTPSLRVARVNAT